MLNIIIILACSISGFCIGKYFQGRIAKRGDFYKDLRRYLETLRLNVTTRQVEIGDFNNNFVTCCSNTFSSYIVNKEYQVKVSSSEKTEVENFFSSINCVSSVELLKNIDYYTKIFDSKYNGEILLEIKKASLYPKLGILCGVMIGILFL